MLKKREAGLLLHISSLPNKYGVGTFGEEAYQFIDFLEASNFKVWQVLPLVPTSYGDSPYQSVSSQAINYYFIDLDILRKQKLLKLEEYKDIKFSYDDLHVDYELLFNNKIKVLRLAFSRFNTKDTDFIKFLKANEYNDFSLFMTIKSLFNFSSWQDWDIEYKSYSKELEDKVVKENKHEYLFWQWTQFEVKREWDNLHKYAKSKNIKIMGDMPLYVAYDSVDVWKYNKLYLLDEDNKPKLVAGCPPDYFSETGQLWGNPIYDWEYLKETNYSWWNNRIKQAFKLYDILRIDHFRGFDRYYGIPYGEKTAINGKWYDGPKFDFFKDKLNLNIVAEDLGMIDEGVRLLLEQTNYPGMKVLEFGLSGDETNEHNPSNYKTSNMLVYTGTHDNNPIYQHLLDLDETYLNYYKEDLRKECKKLNISYNVKSIKGLVKKTVELALASKANLAIIPMQDLLIQDGNSRMNYPSSVSKNNWSYRILKKDLSNNLKTEIASLIKNYKR